MNVTPFATPTQRIEIPTFRSNHFIRYIMCLTMECNGTIREIISNPLTFFMFVNFQSLMDEENFNKMYEEAMIGEVSLPLWNKMLFTFMQVAS